MREVRRYNEQRVFVEELRKRLRAHGHLVRAERAHNERRELEAAAERKPQKRILYLRRVFVLVDLVVAQHRRTERKPVDPFLVYRDFAKRSRDRIRLGRHETVLDPHAVARGEHDDAPEPAALHEPCRAPRNLPRICPASMRQDQYVRVLRGGILLGGA